MSFENKVVLITGAGSGIGEATAILFAKEGADVVIVDRNEVTGNATAEKCKPFGKKVLVVHADISKDDETRNAMEKTIEAFGRLDILINNAGITREGQLIPGTIMDTFDVVMNTNLRAVVHMTSLATPHLIKSKGCVVNTSSIAAKQVKAGSMYPVYTVSKAGVDSFTQLSALELAQHGVRVNAISPGPVNTNIVTNSGVTGICINDFAHLTALRRISAPAEIADLIAFLASDKAKSITGGIYSVDNGMYLV